MKRGKKPKDFVQVGKIRDDHQDMQAFLDKNLQYPEKARQKLTQGTVYVAYSVNDDGKVANARVTRGIGDGCDEEALRLVKMLKFQRVKNRKVKVLANREIGIRFQITQTPVLPQDSKLQGSAGASKPKDTNTTTNPAAQIAYGGTTLQYSYVTQNPATASGTASAAATGPGDTASAQDKSTSITYTLNVASDLSGQIVNQERPPENSSAANKDEPNK